MAASIKPSQDLINQLSIEEMRSYENDFGYYFLNNTLVEFINNKTFKDDEMTFFNNVNLLSEDLINLLEDKLTYFCINNEHFKQKIYEKAFNKTENMISFVQYHYEDLKNAEEDDEKLEIITSIKKYFEFQKYFTEHDLSKNLVLSKSKASTAPRPSAPRPAAPRPVSRPVSRPSAPSRPVSRPSSSNNSVSVRGPKSSSKSVSKKAKLLPIEDIPKSKSKSKPKSKSGHKTKYFTLNSEGRCNAGLFYDPSRTDNKPCLELDKCAEEKFKSGKKQCKQYKTFGDKDINWLFTEEPNKETNRLGRNIDYFSVSDLKKLTENLKKYKVNDKYIKVIENEIDEKVLKQRASEIKEKEKALKEKKALEKKALENKK